MKLSIQHSKFHPFEVLYVNHSNLEFHPSIVLNFNHSKCLVSSIQNLNIIHLKFKFSSILSVQFFHPFENFQTTFQTNNSIYFRNSSCFLYKGLFTLGRPSQEVKFQTQSRGEDRSPLKYIISVLLSDSECFIEKKCGLSTRVWVSIY